MFINFCLYILAAVGLSHILAEGSIVAPFKIWLADQFDPKTVDTLGINSKGWWCKKLFDMLICYQCNGWWSGLIVAILGWLGATWLLWAFAISLVSPVFGYLKLYLSMLTSVDLEEEEDDDE